VETIERQGYARLYGYRPKSVSAGLTSAQTERQPQQWAHNAARRHLQLAGLYKWRFFTNKLKYNFINRNGIFFRAIVYISVLAVADSLLESMACAVEQAAVVLVCFTEKYKDSPNCRTGGFLSAVKLFAGIKYLRRKTQTLSNYQSDQTTFWSRFAKRHTGVIIMCVLNRRQRIVSLNNSVSLQVNKTMSIIVPTCHTL